MYNKLKSNNYSINNNVNIAILDSGVCTNSHFLNYNNIIYGYKNNFSNFYDEHGHGTSVTYLIQKMCKNSKIFIVKVFDNKLVTSTRTIINSIRWCIENDIKIINLSVAITDFINFHEINNICKEAYKKNIFIIAASDNLGRPCLPAYLQNVLGVGIGNFNSKHTFMINPKSQIQLYAKGNNLKTISLNDKIQNVNGSSFATAIMTANIALLIKNNNKITFKKLINILKLNANEFKKNNIIRNNVFFNYKLNCKKIIINNPIKNYVQQLKEISLVTTNVFDIYILSNFNDLLKFNLIKIIYLGEHPDIILNLNKVNRCTIPITTELHENTLKCNSIILSPNFNINNSIVKSNNFFEYTRILKTLDYPLRFICNIKSINKNHIFYNECPVVSLVNLSKVPNITLIIELAVIKLLKSNNYNVSNISSSELSQLFLSDYYYNSDLLKDFSQNHQIIFFKSLLESITNTKKNTDLIVTSIDNGIKPVNSLNVDFFNNLCNITVLCSIAPNTVILIIDQYTQLKSILDSINILKSLIKNIHVIIVFIGINSIYSNFFYSTNKTDNTSILKEVKNLNNVPCFNFNDYNDFKFILKKIQEYCDL